MIQNWKNITVAILSAAVIMPAAVDAQKEDKEKDKTEKKTSDQITVIRKGDKDEKVVIEFKGDKVIVNGKDVEDFKDDNVIIRRNRLRDLNSLRGFNVDQGTWNFGFNDDNMALFGEDNNRAMLGVTTDKEDEGAQIESITKESGAAKAGLKVGDIITKVDDKKIEDPENLTKAIQSHKPGDKVTITYLRDKKEQKATAELTKWKGVKGYSPDLKLFESIHPRIQAVPHGEYDRNMIWAPNRPKLGLSVQDTDDGKGVKVLEVDEESNAAKAGIKENDIITHVNDKEVNSADEVAKFVRENKDKVSMMIKLNRGGKTQNIEVKFPRKLKTVDL